MIKYKILTDFFFTKNQNTWKKVTKFMEQYFVTFKFFLVNDITYYPCPKLWYTFSILFCLKLWCVTKIKFLSKNLFKQFLH